MIFDPNRLNPYGAELGRCLNAVGWRVDLMTGRPTVPGDLRPYAALAGQRPRHPLKAFWWALRRLLCPLALLKYSLQSPGSPIVVVWVRDGWEALVLTVVSFRNPI